LIREFSFSADFPFLIKGAGWTIMLSLITFLGGSIIGLPVAMLRTARPLVLKGIALLYIQIIQGIPVLLLLFLFYFGLSALGYRPPALISVSLGLILYACAFLADIWRGAIQSIPATQWEAAESLALTPLQRMFYVIIPQAVRRAIPPTVGFMVQIVKSTSIASIIGYVELARAGQLVNDSTYQPLLVFVYVAAIYFVMVFPLSAWSRLLERKLHAGRANP